MTRRLVDTNKKMLGVSTYSLFPETLDTEIFPYGPITRVLLYDIRQDKSIRAELSIPVEYECQGDQIIITDWRDRIILPEIGVPKAKFLNRIRQIRINSISVFRGKPDFYIGK